MRSLAVLAVVVVQGIGVASSLAATVEPLSGDVFINNGSGFKPLMRDNDAVTVPAGTQVLVQPGASAQIRYAANCVVRVPSGVWSVKDSAPCADGTSVVDLTQRMNQEAPPTEPGGDATPYVIGGLVVAGAVGAAIALSQDDDDDKGQGGNGGNGSGNDTPGNDVPGNEVPVSP